MSLSKMTIKQELKVKTEVMSYKILNALREKIIAKIKEDTDILLIESSITEKNEVLSQQLLTIPNMVIEDSEKKKEKIENLFKGIVTDQDLKNLISG